MSFAVFLQTVSTKLVLSGVDIVILCAGILLESKTKGFSIFKQLVQSSNNNLYVTTEPDCNQGLGMEEGDS